MGLAVDGSSVVVTGASSGIGEATALALAARGCRLVLVARRADRLADVAARCSAAGAGAVEVVVADLADLDRAGGVAQEADALLGGVDVLVNNAGAPKRRSVVDLTFAEVEATMRLNHLAPVRMTMELLPGMLERRRGCIVNVASLGGRLGILNEAAYSASKFAMCGWSEAMAADLDGTGVDVRLVLPGAIDTEIWDKPGNDPPFYDGPLEPPESVADVVVAAVEGDAVEHYVPDMRAVVELKTADLDAFRAGMLAADPGRTQRPAGR